MNFGLRFETHSEEETWALGQKLAGLLPASGVVLLIGDLGAGKTTLTKGIVEGRGAARAEDVSSPTYTLIHEYGNPVSVHHVDLYRIDEVTQASRLGLNELFDSSALVLIEWGEKFPTLLPEGCIQITLRHCGEDQRIIELKAS